MAAGRRGPQALSVTVLDPAPSVEKNTREAAREEARRHSPDELHGMVADLITLLEGKVQPTLRQGRDGSLELERGSQATEIVTPEGCELITRDVPVDPDAIEALMRG